MLVAVTLFVATAAWPVISTDAPAFAAGVGDAAVVAGVSRPFVLPPVPGAAETATDWFTWLTRARGVPLEHVHLLRDGEVTRERLLAAAAAAGAAVSPGGTLWIVFVGHGAPAASGDDGLLLGVDAQRTEHSLRERGLPQRELLAAAAGPQRHTVAVFDACFSGMASDGRTPLVVGSQATLPIRRDADGDGLVVLSSSEEIAGPLPGHDRPAFSYLLLGALRGWGDQNGDAQVTVAEAFGYARQTLVRAVRDKNQSPSLRGRAIDLVLAERAAERGPDVVQLVATAARPAPPPSLAGADRERLELAYARREIRLDEEKRTWRRGDLPTPLSREELIHAGGAGAPQAVKTLEELETKESWSTLAWVLPPLGGLGVGAVTGLGIAAAVVTANPPEDEFDVKTAYILGPFFGAFAGAAVGAVAVSLPVGMWAQIGEEEQRQELNAGAELANAANAEERKKLGLPP